MTTNRFFALSLAFLTGCGVDVTPVLGSYTGSLTAGTVVDTAYTIQVDEASSGTISISGADFTTFEVNLMGGGDEFTNLPDDLETTLSWVDSELSFSHTAGGESVVFAGNQNDAEGGGTTDDSSSDEAAADLAEGTYHGSITGPTISANYDLTLTIIDANTVEASGKDITSFEIPLKIAGGKVEEAGTWKDGSFSLAGDALSLTYNPQGLSFTGDRK